MCVRQVIRLVPKPTTHSGRDLHGIHPRAVATYVTYRTVPGISPAFTYFRQLASTLTATFRVWWGWLGGGGARTGTGA